MGLHRWLLHDVVSRLRKREKDRHFSLWDRSSERFVGRLEYAAREDGATDERPVAKRRHAIATDASPWAAKRRKTRESQRDGRCFTAGTAQKNVGSGSVSTVWRRFDSRCNRQCFSASINTCRRFATLVRLGWHVHHGFAPMAIACRRFATEEKGKGQAFFSSTMGLHPWLLHDVVSRLRKREKDREKDRHFSCGTVLPTVLLGCWNTPPVKMVQPASDQSRSDDMQ